jgi:Leucine-rich repeat (LRR) protein
MLLENLDLSKTAVRDLSSLGILRRLKILNISHTRVANIEPLSKVSVLESLDVRDTPVREFAALRGLSKLRTVYVSSLQRAAAVDLAAGRVGVASI